MEDQKTSYKKWIRRYLKRYWPASLLLLILGIISDSFVLISPVPTKYLADYVFSNHTPPHWIAGIDKKTLLLYLVTAYVLIHMVSVLYHFGAGLISQKINQIVDKRAMLETFDASNQIPVNNPNRKEAGTYLYQVTGQALNMSEHIVNNGASIVQNIILLLSVLFILFRIDARMTAITFISVPFLILSVKFFGDTLERRATEGQEAEIALYNFVEETLNKLRTIQSFALESVRHSKLNLLIREFHRTQRRTFITDKLFGISTSFIIQVATVSVLILGGISAINGRLTFGDLLLFISYMDSVFDPVAGIVNIMGTIREERAALSLVHKTILDRDNLKLNDGTIKDVPIRGDITYKNVSYNIAGNTIIKNLNLELPHGSINAFVGPSGQGKSTLLNMLLRFVEPTSGAVLIDGHQVSEYELRFLRESISTLEQEPDLFNMSVADNIAISHSDMQYPLPDVIGTAEAANATAFINDLPDKYDTIISNERLSGGQKQRIAYARAIFKHTSIIIMDEPTSALDDKSSEIFVNNIHKYINGQTVIMVTHDLDLLNSVPNIYVVNEGQVRNIQELGGLDSYRAEILRTSEE